MVAYHRPLDPVKCFLSLPPTPDSPNRVFACPGRNRTHDTRFRRAVLYPLSHGDQLSVTTDNPISHANPSAPAAGLEPATTRLTVGRSAH